MLHFFAIFYGHVKLLYSFFNIIMITIKISTIKSCVDYQIVNILKIHRFN